NAEPEVKKRAKYQTTTNDEHGVAEAIYKMLETNN
ncbi:HAD hydrolase family protein, partial [Listeria fleischmannii]